MAADFWNQSVSFSAEGTGTLLFLHDRAHQYPHYSVDGHYMRYVTVNHPYDDFSAVYSDGSIILRSANQSSALSNDSRIGLSIAEKQVPDKSSPDYQRVAIKNSVLTTENVRV